MSYVIRKLDEAKPTGKPSEARKGKRTGPYDYSYPRALATWSGIASKEEAAGGDLGKEMRVTRKGGRNGTL